MKTSIVVPCYGSYRVYLRDCLANLVKQTAPVEIIVAGGTDQERQSFASLCEEFGAEGYIGIRDSQSYLINRGFEVAKGEYYLDMGVDDSLEPTYIEEAEKFLDAHPEYDIFAPTYKVFGLHETTWRAGGLGQETLRGNTMLMGSVIRASLWKKLQGFDENIPYDTLYDWEFWIRAAKAGATVYISDKLLYNYRLTPGATHDEFSKHGTQFMDYAKAKGTL